MKEIVAAITDTHKDEFIYDWSDEKLAPIADAGAPAIFILSGGNISEAKYEKQELGSLRCVVHGSRTIVMLDSEEIRSKMSLSCPDGGSETAAIETWANTVDQAGIKDFVGKGGQVWTVTCGPGDAVFAPLGYLCLHKVQSAGNHVGLKMALASKDDVTVLSQLRQDFHASRRETKPKDALLAFMQAKWQA